MADFFDLYDVGTITLENGEVDFSGTGVVWADIIEGDFLVAEGLIGVIDTIAVGLDEGTLKTPWPGADGTFPYVIIKAGKGRYDPALTQAVLRQVITYLGNAGLIYSVVGAAPDPSVGVDGQYALKTNTGAWKQWLKVAGVWELQGTPVGITNRGVWDSGTEYAVNDLASRLGHVYLSNTVNTNQPPESNTDDWTLFTEKGDTGAQGIQGVPGATWRSGSGAPSNGLGSNGDFYLNTANGDVYTKTAGAYVLSANIKGAQGTAGINGANGVDGRMIRYAAGAPNSGIGNDDDFYIDSASYNLYGPKNAGVWPAGVSLIGPQGVQGANGSNGVDGKTLRYAAGAPSNLLGNDGDFYIDTVAHALYGPKIGGAWPSGASLAGIPGIQGPQGSGIQPNATGTLTQRAAHDSEAQGYIFLETDVAPFKMWIKASAGVGDWAGPTSIGGVAAVGDYGSVVDTVLDSFDYGVAA